MKFNLLIISVLVFNYSFSQVFPHPSLETELSGHTLSFAGGEKFIVCGGYNGEEFVNSVFQSNLYDSSPWEAIEEMNDIRYTHQANTLNNYDVFVSGGWNGDAINHATTEYYSNEFETWIEGPEMNVGRSSHRTVKLSDGKILITGGYTGVVNTNSVDIYDPETNTITAAAPMTYGRSSHTATLLSNGKVLVAGGFNPDYDFQMDECELYDPLTDTWTETGSMNVGRDNHAAPLDYNLDLSITLVTGGRSFNSSLNLFEGNVSTETYDVSTGEWTLGDDLPSGQSYHALYLIDPVWYLNVGGANHTGIEVVTTFSNSSYGDLEWLDCCFYQAEGRYLAASDQANAELNNNPVLVCGGVGNSTCEFYVNMVSVAEQNDSKIQVYPNPTTDFLSFSNANGNSLMDIEIMDLNGKVVLTETNWDILENLDVQSLAKGVYSIHMKSGKNELNQKIVKL